MKRFWDAWEALPGGVCAKEPASGAGSRRTAPTLGQEADGDKEKKSTAIIASFQNERKNAELGLVRNQSFHTHIHARTHAQVLILCAFSLRAMSFVSRSSEAAPPVISCRRNHL